MTDIVNYRNFTNSTSLVSSCYYANKLNERRVFNQPDIPRGDYTSFWISLFVLMIVVVALYVGFILCVLKLCPSNGPSVSPVEGLTIKNLKIEEKPVVGRWNFYKTKREAYDAATAKGGGVPPILNKPHRLGDYCHYHTAGRVTEENGVRFNHHFQFGPKWLLLSQRPNPSQILFDEVFEYHG